MSAYERLLIEVLLKDFEGGRSKIKGDEPTVWGLNSRYYPKMVTEYDRLVKAKDALGISKLREDAINIYARDFLRRIPGHAWMGVEFPGMLTILFLGRVHGTGYKHYTWEVQMWLNKVAGGKLVVDGQLGNRTLTVLKRLSPQQQNQLLASLRTTTTLSRLSKARWLSVQRGGVTEDVSRGIYNRVRNELTLAVAMQSDATVERVARNGPAPLVVSYEASAVRGSRDNDSDSNIFTVA